MWNDINLSKKEEIQSKKNSNVVALSILILISICLSVSYLFIYLFWLLFGKVSFVILAKFKNHQTSKIDDQSKNK